MRMNCKTGFAPNKDKGEYFNKEKTGNNDETNVNTSALTARDISFLSFY